MYHPPSTATEYSTTSDNDSNAGAGNDANHQLVHDGTGPRLSFGQQEDAVQTAISIPPAPFPISGEYDVSRLVSTSSWFRAPRKWSLNLRFVAGNDGINYGIVGDGVLPEGFTVRRPAKSQIWSGHYNRKTGLAWWIELVDHKRVSEILPREEREKYGPGDSKRIVSFVAILSHGIFDFEKMTFQGWFYAQVQGESDFCTIEKVSLVCLRLPLSLLLPTYPCTLW